MGRSHQSVIHRLQTGDKKAQWRTQITISDKSHTFLTNHFYMYTGMKKLMIETGNRDEANLLKFLKVNTDIKASVYPSLLPTV